MKIVPLSQNDYVEAFASSYIGGRAENQDSYGATAIKGGFLMTVCDGMGGGPGGKTASTLAVDTILIQMQNLDAENTIKNNLIRAIRAAHEAILAKGEEQTELKGMGSTCTAVVVTPEIAYVAHVGDSRVYLLHGDKKIFRTNDHSMVFDLVKAKVITEEQARCAENSNVINRALGVTEDLEVEVSEVSYHVGDRFMLCTDGIHGTMLESDLIKLVSDRKKNLGAVVSALVERVNSLGINKGNHHDNLTVIMADCLNTSDIQPQWTSQKKWISIIVSVFVVMCVIFALFKFVSSPDSSDDASCSSADGQGAADKEEMTIVVSENDSVEQENDTQTEDSQAPEIATDAPQSNDSTHNNNKKQ